MAEGNLLFGGIYHFHLQVRRGGERRKQHDVGRKRNSSFLLRFLFDFEVGGGIFLRNIC
jgi:hypothetical protein